jgi:lysyl-tRNA synthetase class II
MVTDEDYVRALSMACRRRLEGVGIDRLVMLLTNQHHRDVICFHNARRVEERDAKAVSKL